MALTPDMAKEILSNNSIRGKELTVKQKKFFKSISEGNSVINSRSPKKTKLIKLDL